MESSKSEGKINLSQNKNYELNGMEISRTHVKEESQSNLTQTNTKEQNEPCCSHTESKKSNLAIVATSSTAENPSCAPSEKSAPVQQEFEKATGACLDLENSSHERFSCSNIISKLFENLELLDMRDFQTSNNASAVVLNNAPSPSPNNSIPAATRNREIRLTSYPRINLVQSLQRGDPQLGPPPSYSKSVIDRRINPCASIQFVAPIPPPSYEGMESELRYLNYSGFTLGLGNTWQYQSQPAYCPICETVTITRTDIRVSRLAHVVALILFFILCWPFCLLPYFLNICNYTFHYCSVCHCYLGARRPFQRS